MGLSEIIRSYIRSFFRTDQKTPDQKLDKDLADTFPASDPTGHSSVSAQDNITHPGEGAHL